MSPPLVSVVVVSWNGAAHIERCLGSLLEHTASVALEPIVVDNASTDGTRALLRERFSAARVIANDENVGFARACNQGMEAARGELLLLLNSDTYVEDDVVGRAARRLLERPEIGMLGCELRFPDGRRQHTAFRALSAWRALAHGLWLYRLLPPARRGEILLGGYWEGERELEVDWLAGAFMLLRRELFEHSGGFDERFFMYGEDSEWCARLRGLGHRILYAPRTGAVVHVGAASSDLAWSEAERLRRCHRGGIEAYAIAHGSGRAQLYRLAEATAATVRWWVYGAAARLRAGGDGANYFARRAALYRATAGSYLRPSRPRP